MNRLPGGHVPPGRLPSDGVLYRLLFSRVLVRLDAEQAHHVAIRLLRLLQAIPGALWLVRRIVGRPDPILATEAFGVTFPSPLGMAAGFDKDAKVYRALDAFGFGFVEIGTVTGQPQPGNPRPRMFRLPADRALVNRMGFNNDGSAAARQRLTERLSTGDSGVVGVNIGKTKVVPAEDAPEDYVVSTQRLAPFADYLVVNVSSPNTPGLRDLQATEQLRPLLDAVRGAAPDDLPVLVKIAPDLADADVDAVADLAVELGLAGIIATNTTISREGLRTGGRLAAETGGLSGAPLRDRAVEVLERLHARVGDRIVLVSVGGVEDVDDVWERLRAGASLVQAYTGVVYGGPGWPTTVSRQLAARLRAGGHTSVAEIIGADA